MELIDLFFVSGMTKNVQMIPRTLASENTQKVPPIPMGLSDIGKKAKVIPNANSQLKEPVIGLMNCANCFE